MKFTYIKPLTALALAAAVLCAPGASTASRGSGNGYHLITKMAVGGTGTWDYMYLDSASRRLYVTRQTHVMVIDVDTHKVIGDIPNLNGIHGVAIDSWSGNGFISNGKANSVVMFDLATLKKKKEIPVGVGPDAIICDPQTKRVYSFNGKGKSFTSIDGGNGTVLGTFTLPGRPEFPASDANGHIYDNLEDLSQVASIAATGNTVEATWPIAPGEGPSGMAYDSIHNRVYSVCANKLLTVLDPSTGKIVTTLPIGKGPDACVFDPGTGMIYAPNGKDGTMTVYHAGKGDKYSLVTTFKTQVTARTMTIDYKTHHIWTAAAILLPPDPKTPAGTKPKKNYKAGSFVLLEYGL